MSHSSQTSPWGTRLDRRRFLYTTGGFAALAMMTGDVHANYAADLKADFDDPASPVIGSEFVVTSISSGGDGADVPANAGVLLSENPHIKFVNAQRGYIVCDVTSRRWRTDYRTVPYVTTEGAPITTRASFVVEAGDPGIQQV